MLVYNSIEVEINTFNPENKDLRKLVGQCQWCNKCIRGKEAIPHLDPFASDVHGNYTLLVQCDKCSYESSREI